MVEVLSRLNEPGFIETLGMAGFRLLDAGKNDLHKVIYSVMLYERGPNANYVRIQADNLTGRSTSTRAPSSTWARPPSCGR